MTPPRAEPNSDADAADIRAPANGIQVISRAASILRSLRDEPDGLSLGQIATRVGLPRSTVQRIVHALIAERLLMAASPTSRVRLGTEILALAANSKIDIVEIAHPHLKQLSEAGGETVDLAVLRRDHLVFLDQVAGSHRLRAVSAVGEIFPLHCTANGKACLALLEEAAARKLLANSSLTLADGTTRTIDDILGELKQVRKSGIAVDEEEHFAGISAVGAAFRDHGGTIYAISIPCPASRFKASRDKLASLLLAARDKLALVIGA
jgi:DNA-binding IclR family transcriptional regulator